MNGKMLLMMTTMVALWVGVISAQDVPREIEALAVPAEAAHEPTPVLTEEERIQQNLEQALLRYRNLAADAVDEERAWLEGTMDLIRRVDERLKTLPPPTLKKTSVKKDHPYDDAPADKAAELPAVAVTGGSARGEGEAEEAVGERIDRSTVLPAGHWVEPSASPLDRLSVARHLEAAAADLLNMAAVLRSGGGEWTEEGWKTGEVLSNGDVKTSNE
jgi:hypothetical protein